MILLLLSPFDAWYAENSDRGKIKLALPGGRLRLNHAMAR